MLTEKDVRNALHNTINSDDVFSWSKDFNFREGALDSLDHATFLLALAEQHDFKFAEQDMPKLNTIQVVLDYAAQVTS
jgi:acyl carrier protein